MQAFDYRHLVPVENLTVAVLDNKPRWPVMELADRGPLIISPGGTVQVCVNVPPRLRFVRPEVMLKDPPKGFSAGAATFASGMLTFEIKADANDVRPGFSDNLIVEVAAQMPVGPLNEQGTRANRRVSLGFLPAIPVTTVQK